MVAKISHGSSLTGVLMYNQNKVDEKEAMVIDSRSIIHSADYTYNVIDSERSFDCHMRANQRTEKPVVHISLNPDPYDNVDDSTAKKIAEEYLNRMGYGNQPYILYKHQDISRTHYHIVTVNIDENGKKISDKFEKRHSMEVCRSIEKEFQLHVPTKKRLFEESLVEKVEYPKGNLLKQIKTVTSRLLETYKVTSLNEYKTLLELHGMTLTQVDGMIDDKQIHGIFYSAIDEDGKKIGRQLKSSLFKNKSGYTDLQNKFKHDKKKITEQNKVFIKRVIIQCMYQCKNRTPNELIELLKKRNIDLVLRINKEGRIYGATFIDHNTKTVLNGSKLSEEFSANRMNDFFNNPYYIFSEKLENKGLEYTPTKEEYTPFFGLSTGGNDADEEVWRRRKRKQKGFNI